jgi:hypothetical protein
MLGWSASPLDRATHLLRAGGCRYSRAVVPKRTAALDALIEEATVDAYDDDEQRVGFLTMLEEHLAVPFATQVLGVEVIVAKIEFSAGDIVAICTRGQTRQAIGILDLPLPAPAPAGAEWIDAYRRWSG